jgi:hypothetical protein
MCPWPPLSLGHLPNAARQRKVQGHHRLSPEHEEATISRRSSTTAASRCGCLVLPPRRGWYEHRLYEAQGSLWIWQSTWGSRAAISWAIHHHRSMRRPSAVPPPPCHHCHRVVRPSTAPPWPLPLVATATMVEAQGGRAPRDLGSRRHGRSMRRPREGRQGKRVRESSVRGIKTGREGRRGLWDLVLLS